MMFYSSPFIKLVCVCVWFRSDVMAERATDDVLQHAPHQVSVCVCGSGQMLWLEAERQILFIGSPLITSLKEMKAMDVYMADIPLFDVTREIVLLYEQRNAEIDVT